MPSVEARRLRDALTLRRPEDTASVEESRLGWDAAVVETNARLSCTVTTLDISGVPGELVEEPVAGNTDRPVVLFLHGGGFNSGSPRTHRELAHRLGIVCGGSIFLPEYRLAPEYPCPAAVDDSVTAYRWLLEQGYRADQIAVTGDSAGGALVVALLVTIRDLDLPLPAGGALLSPWVDLTMSGPSYDSHASLDPFITRAELEDAAGLYLDGRDPLDPVASPLFADLSGLPPMLIHAGGLEILESDSTRLADAASDAGVDVRLTIWDDLWHVFHFWAAEVPEAREAIREIGSFIKSVTTHRAYAEH